MPLALAAPPALSARSSLESLQSWLDPFWFNMLLLGRGHSIDRHFTAETCPTTPVPGVSCLSNRRSADHPTD
jgi:hypothetical protein